jgi:phosphate starvation-inducible PhoH-like protein
MRGQIQDIEPEQIHLAIKEARVLEQSAESVPEYGKPSISRPSAA